MVGFVIVTLIWREISERLFLEKPWHWTVGFLHYAYDCGSVIVFVQVIWAEADQAELRTLRRQKREWIVPPKKLYENVDYTRENYIAKVSVYAIIRL